MSKLILFFTYLFLFSFFNSIYAQRVSLDPFPVKISPVLEQIKAAKANNPNLRFVNFSAENVNFSIKFSEPGSE